MKAEELRILQAGLVDQEILCLIIAYFCGWFY
jgi:hypothetical protein